MTPLERRYRLLLLAYPPAYRAAHGKELLGVLLDCAAPGRTTPEVRESAGLVTGGLRERVRHAARGSAWRDGLHLGATAVMAVQLAVLLPYAGSIPLWVVLSALALLAVLRGRVRIALPLALLTGAKAVAIASGRQLLDVTLLPVYPSFLTARPMFVASSPATVAVGYGLACCCLLALAAREAPPRTRSWWWWAAVPFAAWAGPAWMAEGTPFPISLSRMALELAVLGLAVWAARLAGDPRWALAAALYLLVVSTQLGEHLAMLTPQHLAYWGLLVLLTALAALVPYGGRRRVLLG
ncbi:hypothetical protein [Microtetraspora sp. NBRC 16547]|uniref:hypothetical protein n=1 Tax=Microtetraspora sp. NBRC 16547 TaxID=3030993 RepID=UPI0024A23BED|nr:hypothetical protein [Microtetraspora sp. NBRC 16547]GLX00495.1 hypothetical protein Misp02_45810 [Microtetraspora sp. NBRC 16547]